jgi:hypothetical protein
VKFKPSLALALAGAGLSGKGLYHIGKSFTYEFPASADVQGFISSDVIDPAEEIKKIDIGTLDRPIKIINTLSAAKAAKRPDIKRAYKSVEFGENAYAFSPKKSKFNYIVTSEKVNKNTLHHEIGHLRKGTTIREVDAAGFLSKPKKLAIEEQGAWDFAHQHVKEHPMDKKMLGGYIKSKEGFEGGKFFLPGAVMLGIAAALGKKGL